MLNLIILVGIAIFAISLFMSLFRIAILRKENNKHERKLNEYKLKSLFYGVPSLKWCQRKVEMSGFAPDRNVRFFVFCRNGFRHG